MLDLPIELNANLHKDTNNIVFIDVNVEEYDGLLSLTNSNTDIILLDPLRDGIDRISEVLANRTEIASVHLVSHGEPGKINLGNAQLSPDTWDSYRDRLADWSAALTDDADFIVYGCNVATSNDGRQLIDDLANITTADVAASDDLTGNSALGGDWDWEVTTGAIESQLPFMADAVDSYQGVLHMSGHDTVEHQTFLDLVPHDIATHIAIKNGHWFDPTVWQNGKVPDDSSNVLIPEGHRVWYGRESEARLDTLRVDGYFQFASKFDTKMLVDTFVVSPQGKLVIGTADNPVRASNKTEVIFTSDTAIDTNWDPKQLSRGLISHGKVEIYGADKLDHVALVGDALKGDNELVLDLPEDQTSPLGWKVGDRLVLGGTKYRPRGSDENNTRFFDEELTITAINGNRIRFTNDHITSGDNTVLRFDHQRPEDFENKVDLYVANTTRNVTFETENGDSVPTKHRGHVMFMHNPDVVVENAGFYNLGRTDKNKLIDDPGQNVDGSKGYGTNPRGRYSLHFHRTGSTEDPSGMAALAKGNAIVDSPGWGLVHHDGHAVFEDNVVFDVVGSGIAAEAGNEIGAWRNNITIKMTGDDDPGPNFNGPREYLFDFGYNGEGYWVQGAAQVAMTDNIAISSHTGVALFGLDGGSEHLREVQTISVASLPPNLQNIAKGTEDESVVDVSTVPIRQLSGFESYNTSLGIMSWGRKQKNNGQLNFSIGPGNKPTSAHNFRSLIKDFRVWNIFGEGVALSYSSNIDLENGLILGKPQQTTSSGITFNDSSFNFNFSKLHIEDFVNGIRVPYDADKDFVGSKIENSYFANNQNNFAVTDAQLVIEPGKEDFPTFFQVKDNTFERDINNIAPTARFSSQVIGELAISFDANASFDGDSIYLNKASKGIVSYGWDFNNDGNIDKFGRQVSHCFDHAGSHNVSLTVWDSDGASKNLTKTIDVQQANYRNAVIDSDFSNVNSFAPTRESNSIYSDGGWFVTPGAKYDSRIGNGGAVTLANGNPQSIIGQVIQDNGMRRGKQTFSIDIKNIEGLNKDHALNQITIKVWGVNGEFDNKPYDGRGPSQVGILPMASKKILEQTVGGSDFDWKTFRWDVDLADGYQFLLLQIEGTKLRHDGDYVAIDNVRLR